MNTETKRPKRTLPLIVAGILAIAVVVGAFLIIQQFTKNDRTSTTASSSEKPTTNTEEDNGFPDATSVDDMMNNFQGTDEEVKQICATELDTLDIEYISIDEPLEGAFIQETRVGTYELNGILRTPSNSPDMTQPKSTEMLCTIFPDDEYPVEITFGKDW